MTHFLSEEKRRLLAQALLSKEKRELVTQKAQARAAAQPARRPDPAAPAPLSSAQQRFWLLHQLDPAVGHCNLAFAFSLQGELRPEVLSRTLREVVQRHESLRTSFPVREGEPVQVVSPTPEIDFAARDLSALPAVEREPVARAFIGEEAMKPFDLAAGSCVRFRLLRFSEQVHWLLLVAHHIVFDTWSFGVFSEELAAIYEAFSRERPSPLPEPKMQYADFACLERRLDEEGRFDSQLAYWTAKLEGAPALLPLPFDRPRAPFRGRRGSSETFVLGRPVVEALNLLSQSERASVFMILLASLNILLYRYGCGRDIVVGSAVGNRKLPDTDRIIGCFINTLIFRTRLAEGLSFRELVRQVRDECLEAYEHADVPLQQVVSSLNPKRHPSYSPYSQVLLIAQNTDLPRLACSGLAIERLYVPERLVTQQDLTIHVRACDDTLQGLVDYNSDLFDASTIRLLLRRFEQTLTVNVKDPDRPISHLDLLTPPERARLVTEAAPAAPPHSFLHRLIEREADRAPDRTAVICGDERLTYSELNSRANELARRLLDAGAGPERVVAVCLEPSPGLAVAILGVLKTGGACLPLPASGGNARLRALLKRCAPVALLTERRLAAGLATKDVPTLLCDAARPETPPANPRPALHPSQLAFVLAPAAPTGGRRPVLLSHAACESGAQALREAVGLQRGDVLALSFNAAPSRAALSLLAALSRAAAVVLLPDEEAADEQSLRRSIERSGATALQITTPALRQLLASGWSIPHGLKVLCYDETLPRDLVADLNATEARAWKVYGQAETSFAATFNRLESGQPSAVGASGARARVFVLDEQLQPAPSGVRGELHVGGAVLARAYLGRPRLTAESFRPHPLSTEPGARLYQTGDIARSVSEDGFRFLYRSAQQTMLHQRRVNLGEIEAALRLHPLVVQAVVTTGVNASGLKEVRAYVRESRARAAEGPASRLQSGDLDEFLRMQLPDYMVPSVIAVGDKLPPSNDGGLDSRLPATDEAPPSTARAFRAPGSETERAVARIWAGVLRLERVGADEDFFDLGGDSLKAQRVLSHVEAELGLSLPPPSVFRYSTVAQLSTQIERVRRML